MPDSPCCRFLRSTIGLKVLMALTGVVLFGFVIAHVAGNLLVFGGPSKMDAYAAMLKASPTLLWGARVFLLASVLVHIVTAVKLAARRRDARPVPYGLKEAHGTTYAARTQYWSGPILALFVVYHLLHFTVGVAHPSHPSFNAHTVHANVVTGFRSVPVVAAYLIAMACLCLHLRHGVWSALQTLGVNRPNWEKGLRCLATCVATAVFLGFVSIPIAVQFGLLK
jgi:succinate dehydrogenase / fumarate reductase cytochrome b subunit